MIGQRSSEPGTKQYDKSLLILQLSPIMRVIVACGDRFDAAVEECGSRSNLWLPCFFRPRRSSTFRAELFV